VFKALAKNPSTARQIRHAFELACVIAVQLLLLYFFYDRFWYPPDEGNYAHVAQRLLNGEILNLQIQDVHAGYINFVNAAALGLFGSDLVSLRYPLVLISLAQAVLIFALFRRKGRQKPGWVASLAMTALGVIQFLNPTSNWYSLFIAVTIVCSLEWIPHERRSRLLVVGILLGILTLFRQLSGILVSIGVLAYLLIETRSQNHQVRDLILARTAIAVMGLGLGLYLFRTTDLTCFVLFGFCPLALLVWLFFKTTTVNREVIRIILWLGVGGIVAALPLVFYHLFHNSLGPWLNDSVITAFNLTRLRFMDQQLYSKLIAAGFSQLLFPRSFGEFLNGFYWLMLPLLGFLNGIAVLRTLSQDPALRRTRYTLPVVVVFYAVVSVHFQIPIYLYYTASISVASLLWIVPTESKLRYAAVPATLLLSGIAIYYHAAQPVSGLKAAFDGKRTVFSLNNEDTTLPRSHLRIELQDHQKYLELLRVIETETKPDETIFALPSNAELYFLSGRKNPFSFYNTALGIRDDRDFQHVRETIIKDPPALVIYRPDDKYNTSYSREIIKLVRERYELFREVSEFEIYRKVLGWQNDR
jgi:dolichyl-phosphate-mannose-protein mannosyltransferase